MVGTLLLARKWTLLLLQGNLHSRTAAGAHRSRMLEVGNRAGWRVLAAEWYHAVLADGGDELGSRWRWACDWAHRRTVGRNLQLERWVRWILHPLIGHHQVLLRLLLAGTLLLQLFPLALLFRFAHTLLLGINLILILN